MHAEARCYRLDRVVADMTEAVLDRLHDIHESSAIRSELLDEALNGFGTGIHRPGSLEGSGAGFGRVIAVTVGSDR
jgi:hypothetical protein